MIKEMPVIICGGIIGYIIGMFVGIWIVQYALEDITGLRTGDFKSLVESCEAALTRDKFCKLEIKAVEE